MTNPLDPPSTEQLAALQPPPETTTNTPSPTALSTATDSPTAPAGGTMPHPDQALTAYAEALIWDGLSEGYASDPEIVEYVTWRLQSDYPDIAGIRPLVERLTEEWGDYYYDLEATWKRPTDNDRLDRAFAKLNRRGIVARQNFSWLSYKCAWEDMYILMEEEEKAGRTIKGCAFYTPEDMTSARLNGELFIHVGEDGPNSSPYSGVGRQVLRVLERVGLRAEWSDSYLDGVYVTPFRWQKRRRT
jgi:hypothetical protein